MGEARIKRLTHAQILERNPKCIYCGGKHKATSIEHMPPRVMFRGKLRPNELVFPTCEECNKRTSHADLVASFLGRIYPDGNDIDRDDVRRILKGISNNIPDVLLEMKMPRAAKKFAHARYGIPMEKGGFIKVGGPLVSAYIDIFTVKLGLAFFFETTGKIVGPKGMVSPFWFPNAHAHEMPGELRQLLPAPKTLKQGTMEVSDQFLWSYALVEDRSQGIFFATFRQSFGCGCFVSETDDLLGLDDPNDLDEVYSPGSFFEEAFDRHRLAAKPLPGEGKSQA